MEGEGIVVGQSHSDAEVRFWTMVRTEHFMNRTTVQFDVQRSPVQRLAFLERIERWYGQAPDEWSDREVLEVYTAAHQRMED